MSTSTSEANGISFCPGYYSLTWWCCQWIKKYDWSPLQVCIGSVLMRWREWRQGVCSWSMDMHYVWCVSRQSVWGYEYMCPYKGCGCVCVCGGVGEYTNGVGCVECRVCMHIICMHGMHTHNAYIVCTHSAYTVYTRCVHTVYAVVCPPGVCRVYLLSAFRSRSYLVLALRCYKCSCRDVVLLLVSACQSSVVSRQRSRPSLFLLVPGCTWCRRCTLCTLRRSCRLGALWVRLRLRKLQTAADLYTTHCTFFYISSDTAFNTPSTLHTLLNLCVQHCFHYTMHTAGSSTSLCDRYIQSVCVQLCIQYTNHTTYSSRSLDATLP